MNEALYKSRPGAPAPVEVYLNGLAPAEALFGVQVLRDPGAVEVLREEVRIPVNMSTGRMSARLPAGEYQVALAYARFVDQSGPGDQVNLLTPPSPREQLQVIPRRIELRAELEPHTLAEGMAAPLRGSATG